METQHIEKRFDLNRQFSYQKIHEYEQNGTIFTRQESKSTFETRVLQPLQITQENNIQPPKDKNLKPDQTPTKEKSRYLHIDDNMLNYSPYCHFLRLEVRCEDKISNYSAVLIGPRHVLAAVHGLYDKQQQKWAKSIKVRPIQEEGNNEGQKICVINAYKFADCDMALLVLDTAIGEKLGWLGMLSYSDKEALKKEDLKVAEYINTEGEGNRVNVYQGKVQQVDQDMISYDIDIPSSQNGSPIWIENSSGCFVVGLHLHSGSQSEKLSKGVLFTQDRLKIILNYMEKTFSIVEPVSAEVEQGKYLS